MTWYRVVLKLVLLDLAWTAFDAMDMPRCADSRASVHADTDNWPCCSRDYYYYSTDYYCQTLVIFVGFSNGSRRS